MTGLTLTPYGQTLIKVATGKASIPFDQFEYDTKQLRLKLQGKTVATFDIVLKTAPGSMCRLSNIVGRVNVELL